MRHNAFYGQFQKRIMIMLKEIAKLKIKGGIFTEEVTMPFLAGDREGTKYRAQGAIVYGRNGSGKSTISNAFLMIKNGLMPGIVDAQVLDIDGKTVILDENDKKRIFVFNEEFIDKKVKIDKSGIDTIVMLGPSIGKEEELTEAKKRLDEAEAELEKARKEKEKFEEKNGDDNPETIKEKIKKELKKTDGWSDREKLFNESGRLSDSIWQEIAELIVSETQSALYSDFNQERINYDAAKSGETKIEGYIPDLVLNYDEESIINLLSVKVEKPELTEREQWLIGLSVGQVIERKEHFEKPETKVCPYCGRETDADFKAELIRSFNKKLSKAVEEHVNNLSEKQEEIKKLSEAIARIQLDSFKPLPEYSNCVSIIESIDKLLMTIAGKLDEKIHNPHTSIVLSATELGKLLGELDTSIKKLKSEQEEHNKKVSDIDGIVGRLKDINKKIAKLEIEGIYADYKKKLEEQKKACADYNEKEKKKAACEAEKKRLEKEKEALKPDIAVEIINEYLEYI